MKITLSTEEREWAKGLGESGNINLFKKFRLDLQDRILNVKDDDLIKLQGKIEFCDELKNFFLGLLK